MPRASPLVIAKPPCARLRAKLRAVPSPAGLARRLPTIASWGRSRVSGAPSTYSSGGASATSASSAGYPGSSHISRCLRGPSSQRRASPAASRTAGLRRAAAASAGTPRVRQALAGAASAEEAEPKASIKRRKRMGPSSGRPCRRSRASSSAGEWFFIATHP